MSTVKSVADNQGQPVITTAKPDLTVIELAVPGRRASFTLKQGRLLAYAILSAVEEAQDGSVVVQVSAAA